MQDPLCKSKSMSINFQKSPLEDDDEINKHLEARDQIAFLAPISR